MEQKDLKFLRKTMKDLELKIKDYKEEKGYQRLRYDGFTGTVKSRFRVFFFKKKLERVVHELFLDYLRDKYNASVEYLSKSPIWTECHMNSMYKLDIHEFRMKFKEYSKRKLENE